MVTEKRYVPECGDIVWLTLGPVSGREQSGRRPVLVLTDVAYNGLTGLMVICPLTSKVKNYPFEILVNEKRTKGALLVDHVRSCDWRNRQVKFIERAPISLVDQARRTLVLLIGA